MNRQQRDAIRDLLETLHLWQDPATRKAFLRGFLREHEIWHHLIRGGSDRQASDDLLALCERYASMPVHDRAPICALLSALRQQLAADPERCATLDRLTAALCNRALDLPRTPWRRDPYRVHPSGTGLIAASRTFSGCESTRRPEVPERHETCRAGRTPHPAVP